MTPSGIVGFRRHVASILASRPNRVIVLGVDGIPYDLACRVWRRARVTPARSVFPSTSATAWLASLSGKTVDEHGIPGVVFEVDGELIDVYSYRGPLGDPPDNLFDDAAALGYAPVAILGDLEDTHCTWRDQLVHGARVVRGHTFFARDALDASFGDRLRAIPIDERSLVWCFIDADRHIHHHGYDPVLIEFLETIDAVAAEWSRDAVVIAHSDHGLVPTRHDPNVAAAIERTGCRMGGAGRTRWLYAKPGDEARVREVLARDLPASVRIRHADELFAPGSLARRRVGSIVLIAEGEDFLVQDGYRFEHGSMTDDEMSAAVAEWRT